MTYDSLKKELSFLENYQKINHSNSSVPFTSSFHSCLVTFRCGKCTQFTFFCETTKQYYTVS